MKTRILTSKDWQVWKQFRLEALLNSPESFGSSYEEEINYSDDNWQSHINKSKIFAVFFGDLLVGAVGFYSLNTVRTKHRGVLFGMYTRPEYRKQNIANVLLERVITYAESHVRQLHLTCVASNLEAINFYQKRGFKIYGTEPRALKIADIFFDEHLMVLDLTKNSSSFATVS